MEDGILEVPLIMVEAEVVLVLLEQMLVMVVLAQQTHIQVHL
jgi:hypothetical protein